MEKMKKVNLTGGSDSLAFTLAEVLITLAIIGIVAALTIPTVVTNYQKTQTATRLKKAYAVISNATNLAIAQKGSAEGWTDSTTTNGIGVDDIFSSYFKILKDCGIKTGAECFAKNKCYTNLARQCVWGIVDNWPSIYKYILADGTSLGIRWKKDENGSILIAYYIDVDGPNKGPSIMGRDLFHFLYDTQHARVYPQNINSPIYTLTQGCANDGQLCAAKIMADGWQIKDDYPWHN